MAAELAIDVRDERNEPVLDATVLLHRADAEVIQPVRSSDGRFVATVLESLPCTVAAWSPRHVQRTITVREAPSGVVVLQLEEGATLKGLVNWASGGPVGQGMDVVATRWGKTPVLGPEGKAGTAIGSEAWRAKTDPGGHFSLGPLPRGTKVAVRAGGPGAWMRSDLGAIRAQGQEITLELWSVYGARVRLIENGGRPFGGNASLRPPLVTLSPADLAGLVPWNPSSSDRAACFAIPTAGSGADATDARGFAEVELVFLGQSRKDFDGPITYHARFAGYQSQDFPIPLSRVDLGERVETIALQPIAQSWGELEVRFNGGPGIDLVRGHTWLPWVYLRLENDELGTWMVKLEDPANRPIRLSGIPAGSYDVKVLAQCTLFICAPSIEDGRRCVVQPNESTTLEFDLARAGRILFDVTDEAGEPHEGQLVVEVVSMDGDPGSVFQAWSAPPYDLGLVEPGHYGFVLHHPFGYGGETASVEAEVASGDVVIVPLSATK